MKAPEIHDWKKFWNQFTPEQRSKLESNRNFMTAYNADDFFKCGEIAFSLTQPQINHPKAAKAIESAYKILSKVREEARQEARNSKSNMNENQLKKANGDNGL